MIEILKQSLDALDISVALNVKSNHHGKIVEAYESLRQAIADLESQEPVAWDLADKVRQDLDRQSCPDAFMRIAVESIVKHHSPQPAQRTEQEPVSEKEIAEWAERHDIQGTPTDLRCMFEDAASLFTPPAQPAIEEDMVSLWASLVKKHTTRSGNCNFQNAANELAQRVAAKLTLPQRKPLTDEDIQSIANQYLHFQIEGYEVSGIYNFVRAIEAVHGITEKGGDQ